MPVSKGERKGTIVGNDPHEVLKSRGSIDAAIQAVQEVNEAVRIGDHRRYKSRMVQEGSLRYLITEDLCEAEPRHPKLKCICFGDK